MRKAQGRHGSALRRPRVGETMPYSHARARGRKNRANEAGAVLEALGARPAARFLRVAGWDVVRARALARLERRRRIREILERRAMAQFLRVARRRAAVAELAQFLRGASKLLRFVVRNPRLSAAAARAEIPRQIAAARARYRPGP